MQFANFARLAIVMALCATPLSAQPTARGAFANGISPASFAGRILAVHNIERRGARVAPVAWDEGLASGAAEYARVLAISGRFQHSDRRQRRGIGENLWMGPQGVYPVERMIGGWVQEKHLFAPGIFPAVSRNGRWMSVAHYSQMVWPTTQRIGCGVASLRGRDILVCRYTPAGNIDGRRVP